jgi:hypothetical protein
VNSIDPEVARLRQQVSHLEGVVSNLDREIDTLKRTIPPALASLRAELKEFHGEYKHDRDIQNARNARDDVDRELSSKFGRYKEVRELAANMIRIVHAGFIDREVVLDVAQRRMIDTPDYWLAPAVIAVAAWLSGDQGRCSGALHLALSHDPGKTTLFMALLLRDHPRVDAMQQWIAAYLDGLAPTNLPRDFEVVVAGVAGGALGNGSAPELAERMTEWYDDATRSRDAEAGAIEQWNRRLRSLAAPGDYKARFPVLSQYCPPRTWELLRERHEVSTAIEAASRYFPGRFAAGADVPASLSDQVSTLLRRLAETPDPAEEKLLRKRREAEAFIETGDRDTARRRVASEEAGRTDDLNILSMVSTAAFPSAAGGHPPPTSTELLTLVISGRLISKAADRLHADWQRPESVEVRVGRRQERGCFFTCASDAEVTRDALGGQADAHLAQLQADIDRQMRHREGRLRRFAGRVLPAALPLALALGAAPFLIRTGVPKMAFIIPALAIAIPAVIWLVLLPARLRGLVAGSIRDKDAIASRLGSARDELAGFFEQERHGTECLRDLQEYLDGLTPDVAYDAIRLISSRSRPRSRDLPAWAPTPPPALPGFTEPDGPLSMPPP